MPHRFSSLESAVQAIAQGKVVIVLDDENRENEGDFVCAAEGVSTETINFMLDGHGQLCAPVLPATCDRLHLHPLVQNNTSPLSTAYMTPVDHAGCKTGITAAERAETIRRLASETSKATDFVRPGHVYPLLAKEGGVLRRAGHTEAVVDLARMAGLTPAGVLCEILNDSGDRATRDELVELATRHRLEIITVEQIIAHRRVNEKLVTRSSGSKLTTPFGTFDVFVYKVLYEPHEPIVFVMGDLDGHAAPLVRVHSSAFAYDLISILRGRMEDRLTKALHAIARDGCGVLVYLPHDPPANHLASAVQALSAAASVSELPNQEAAELLFQADTRDYGIGIQVLKDLGLRDVRLLTNNPKKTEAFNLRGFDLRIVGQEPL